MLLVCYLTRQCEQLHWTDTPEASYILEYNTDVIADEEIIKMAESAEAPEEK